jgi:hypothetical protein
MSKRYLELYQYIAPAILAPLSFWLWWRTYHADPWLTLMAWLTPIVFAYVVPGIGTNVLKVWEFDTRLRLGRFRPHHGFVFGSATATIAWLCHAGPAQDGFDVLRTAFVLASVLGFWNLLYDIRALEAGILRVYNQPWADGRGPEAIAIDYAPWFFAGFGAVYGAAISVAELLAIPNGLGATDFAWLFPLTLIVSITFPVWGYRHRSFRRHGHSGCRPIVRKTP